MGFGNSATGQHSWTIGETETRTTVASALEAGINFFDTAPGYQNGTSELYLGTALKKLTKRENVVLATKFLPRSPSEIAEGISAQAHIEKSLTASLERLGTDYVDLFIYHMWDYRSSLYDVMDGLNRVVRAGKARYIGISNCFAWQLAKANNVAQHEGFPSFVSLQSHYNLIFREEEREMIPLCTEDGILLTPYSPLAGGRLCRRPGEQTKRLQKDSYAKLKYDATQSVDALIIQRVAELAEKRGASMTGIALAWLLSKGTVPVVGATKASQVTDFSKAAELTLTGEEVRYLEEPYVPHALVGVMAQNTPAAADLGSQVWFAANSK